MFQVKRFKNEKRNKNNQHIHAPLRLVMWTQNLFVLLRYV